MTAPVTRPITTDKPTLEPLARAFPNSVGDTDADIIYLPQTLQARFTLGDDATKDEPMAFSPYQPVVAVPVQALDVVQ